MNILNKFKKHHRPAFAFVIGTAVVLFWRGLWGLLDIYLFPNNLPLSYLTSIALGLLVLYATSYWVKELE